MILVTGAAGFIGYHVTQRLLREGHDVIGLDNLNPYYDVSLKEARLASLRAHSRFSFERLELADAAAVSDFFRRIRPDRVVHLAAQAGVRYSLTDPHAYTQSNVTGFLNVLEGCRAVQVSHLTYASSSSVYGLNTSMPFSVHDRVDHPVSLYAATKKANELMAHSYSHLFGLPTTVLRVFTAYGPWGRPDMALFLFTQRILEGKPIDVFNNGAMKRDFTYVDDISEGIARVAFAPPTPDPAWNAKAPDPASSRAPYRLYNIGNHSPVSLLTFIEVIERCLKKKAVLNFLPLQPGDVLESFADVSDLERAVGFAPKTSLEDGVARFIEWYRSYYRV